MRRILATGLGLLAALALAPSAQADPHRCHRNPTRAFRSATPGAVVDVTQWTCVQKIQTMADGFAIYRAWVTTEWDHAFLGRPVQFEHYTVRVRLERNRRGRDKQIGARTCRLKRLLNQRDSNPRKHECVSLKFRLRPNARFSADGVVSYDVDRDGKGAGRWSLVGSPTV